MSLQFRVDQLNIDNLTIDKAKEAECILEKLTLDDVRCVSPAAATFFLWVSVFLFHKLLSIITVAGTPNCLSVFSKKF